MSFREFLIEWKEWGFAVAMHNILFRWVHRGDWCVCSRKKGEPPCVCRYHTWGSSLTEEEKDRVARGINQLLDHEPETPEEVDAFLCSEGLSPGIIAEWGRMTAAKEFTPDYLAKVAQLKAEHEELQHKLGEGT